MPERTITASLTLSEACCKDFRAAVNEGTVLPTVMPSSVQFILKGKSVHFCPFCGDRLFTQIDSKVKFDEPVEAAPTCA